MARDAAAGEAGNAGTLVLRAVARAMRRAGPLAAVSVGYSGGVDSSVLLHALHRLAAPLGLPPPRALHVDHGLEAQSAAWRAHCRRECERHGIDFHALTVDARAAPGHSPEAAARAARYAALASCLAPGEALCLAHHADDQAETVLMHLLRAGGPTALAAMAPERPLGSARVLRPMLELRRRDIARCAAAWDIAFVSDPANERLHHPRVRLRRQVLPLLEDMEPAAVAILGRAAQTQREVARSVHELAGMDLAACRGDTPGALSRAALAGLPGRRRREALRRWLHAAGVPPAGRGRLVELERQLLSSRPDRHPRVAWPGCEVRIDGDRVLAFRGRPPPAPVERWTWQPDRALLLPTGRLWAEPVTGAGLRAGGALEVSLRSGGERCRPAGRRHSQSLKRLLQERRVPAWYRAGLPLLYRDGALVAVADLWVCHGHQANPRESGWKVHWEPGDRPLRWR